MTLQYPIADTARLALLEPGPFAGSEGAARRLAAGPVSLALEWVKPDGDEAERFEDAARDALSAGYVQVYQDARGRPVLAVTYWRREVVEEQLDALANLGGMPDAPNAAAREDLTPILPMVPSDVRGVEDRIVEPGDKPKRSKGRPRSREQTRQLGLFGEDDFR